MSKQVEITEAVLDELDALAEKAEVSCARCDISDCHICPRTVFRDAASPDVVRALVALVRRELAEVTRERDALEAEVVNLRIAEAKA